MISNRIEPSANAFASDPTDHQTFLGITQKFLRPIDRTAIGKFDETVGRHGVDMKAEIGIIAAPACAFFVDDAGNVCELLLKGQQKL